MMPAGRKRIPVPLLDRSYWTVTPHKRNHALNIFPGVESRMVTMKTASM